MLDVRRLRLLRELSARGTVSAVADALNYTPSAVSQQLAVLEREAGVELLERVGRRVRLTAAGERLVDHAEAVLARLEEAEADLAAAAGGVAGTVKVASFQTGARSLVAPAIVRLARTHPQLRCELHEMEAEESLPLLRLGDVDVAVAEEYEHAPRPRDSALERHELGEDRLVLVLHPDHPAAASGRPVPLAQLADDPWVLTRPHTRFADMFERAARSLAGFEPDVRHRTNDIGLFISAAANGSGVALVPMLGQPHESQGVAVREIADRPLARTIFAAVRRGSASHPAVAAVLEGLRASARDAGLVARQGVRAKGRAMRRSLLGALLGLLLLPAGADAGVVTIDADGRTLRYTARSGDSDQLGIRRDGADIVITSFEATTPFTEEAAACDPPDFGVMRCSGVAPGLTRILVTMLDGEDSVGFSDLGAIVAEADLGAGNDTANPVDQAQPFQLVLRGGTGRDALFGGSLNDLLDGGADADLIDGAGGPDEIIGGSGFDEAHYDFAAPARTDGVTVTLDDQPNDGTPGSGGAPGEGDNVHSDVEDLFGTDEDDVLVGSAASNALHGLCGNDQITGGGGFDVMFGDRDFTGCGGDDTIFARDGLGERVGCGAGTDKVVSDDIDGVSECETNDSSPDAVLDRDNDGSDKPGDCDDTDPKIHPGAPDVQDDGIDQDCDGADDVDLDRDNDNFNRPQDCDDNRANVFPGADEVPGNGRDEDCSGADARPPVVSATYTFASVPVGRRTRFTDLEVDNLRRGDVIRVSCSRGCKRRRVVPRRAGARSLTRFVRRPLPAGARLELRVSRAGAITVLFRFTMRARRQPRVQRLCLPAGARRPRGCA